MAFDSSSNLLVTNFTANSVSRFSGAGTLLNSQFVTGLDAHPESISVDRNDNFYVGRADGTQSVQKFNRDGGLLATFRPATTDRGTDWIELAEDQCTLYYTSEGSTVKRFDVCQNTQLSDFAIGLPRPCFALRLIDNNEVLVACHSEIRRLNSSGGLVKTYDAPGEDTWFALNLDPDGVSFWSGNLFSGKVYKFDIETGLQLHSFATQPNTQMAGLAVFGELTTARIDTDGDGLLDAWEEEGLDVNGDGSIDLDLPAMGASPQRLDVFLEIDYMSGDHGHRLTNKATDDVENAFENAPIPGCAPEQKPRVGAWCNPDGSRGISLHIDNGPESTMNPLTDEKWAGRSKSNSLPHDDVLGKNVDADGDGEDDYDWSDEFDPLKRQNFARERIPAFHYAISGHEVPGASGISRAVPGSDIVLGLHNLCRKYILICVEHGGTDANQATILMHELGHNLGLCHGGAAKYLELELGASAEFFKQCNNAFKPNYLSVMNYSFSSDGIIKSGKRILDYSRFDLGDLNENQLREPDGLTGGSDLSSYGTAWFCKNVFGSYNTTPETVNNADGRINWDCSVFGGGDVVSADVDHGFGVSTEDKTILVSSIDWPYLIFVGGAIGDLAPEPLLPTITPGNDLPIEVVEAVGRAIVVGDLTPPNTTATLSPDPANGERGWFTSDVTVSLTATDPDPGDGTTPSGVADTQYQVNGSGFQAYTGPFVVDMESVDNVVEFFSTDVAGNVEVTKSVSIKLDKTPPTIAIDSGEADDIVWDQAHLERGLLSNDSVLNVDCNATDNLALYEVRAVDVGSATVLDSDNVDQDPPISQHDCALQVPLREGINTIDLIAEDGAGWEDAIRIQVLRVTPGAHDPRSKGFWINAVKSKKYTMTEMNNFVIGINVASDVFGPDTRNRYAELSLSRAGLILNHPEGSSMEQKMKAQLLADWLNMVSGRLAIKKAVNVSRIGGWPLVMDDIGGNPMTFAYKVTLEIEEKAQPAPLTHAQATVSKNLAEALDVGSIYLP